MTIRPIIALLCCAAAASVPASARQLQAGQAQAGQGQSRQAPAQSTMERAGGLLGGMSGLLGGGLPNIASTGAGNAAGLLGYCIKNNVLGANQASGAGSLLNRLTARRGVQSSNGYLAGQQGEVQTGGRSFSLSGVKDQVRGQICSLVLRRAQSLVAAR